MSGNTTPARLSCTNQFSHGNLNPVLRNSEIYIWGSMFNHRHCPDLDEKINTTLTSVHKRMQLSLDNGKATKSHWVTQRQSI